MKKLVLILITAFFCFGLQTAMAVEFNSTDQTDLYPSEAQAFKAALKITDEIRNNKNDAASSSAALYCPADNNPKFRVTLFEMKTFWMAAAASSVEKKYVAVINFVVICRRPSERAGKEN